MLHADAEDALEQTTIALFEGLGWRAANGYDEVFGPFPALPIARI